MKDPKTGLDNAIKTKIIRVIEALMPSVKIYLFGSRAAGKHQERSDIDIALDAGKELALVDVGEIKNMLNESNIPYQIDIVDIHAVSPQMKANILTKGIPWKE